MIGIIDAVIILIILLFGVTGLKNGFFKQVVITIGTILVFVISYYLKDYIADFLSYNLPFFDFSGSISGLVSLNIIMYQMVSFLIVFAVLSAILGILIKITGIFEKILKYTIVLGIPSKILGFLFGLVEGYVIVFIALFFLNQPVVDLPILEESKFMPTIVNSSVGLSDVVEDMNDATKEIYVLVKDYIKDNDSHKFNVKSIDIMLKYKIIDANYMDKLVEKDKIKISGITIVINKYR